MVANDDGVVMSFEGEKTAYSLSHWENLRESHSMLPEYITTGLIVTGMCIGLWNLQFVSKKCKGWRTCAPVKCDVPLVYCNYIPARSSETPFPTRRRYEARKKCAGTAKKYC